MTTSIGPVPVLHTGFSTPGAVATPWADVERILDDAEMFWLSTVRADGSPHVCPLPAMWLGGALYFVTGWEEQKAVNLVLLGMLSRHLPFMDEQWKHAIAASVPRATMATNIKAFEAGRTATPLQ